MSYFPYKLVEQSLSLGHGSITKANWKLKLVISDAPNADNYVGKKMPGEGTETDRIKQKENGRKKEGEWGYIR